MSVLKLNRRAELYLRELPTERREMTRMVVQRHGMHSGIERIVLVLRRLRWLWGIWWLMLTRCVVVDDSDASVAVLVDSVIGGVCDERHPSISDCTSSRLYCRVMSSESVCTIASSTRVSCM